MFPNSLAESTFGSFTGILLVGKVGRISDKTRIGEHSEEGYIRRLALIFPKSGPTRQLMSWSKAVFGAVVVGYGVMVIMGVPAVRSISKVEKRNSLIVGKGSSMVGC
ncbi:hypothetical protein BKA57DRAFT_433187 [Linnemannia elongata]|nr:hypothetical protein BKA57DRAFT_433187 [Linnemannia elongata]